MELWQVAHQGALPLDAIPQDLHQEILIALSLRDFYRLCAIIFSTFRVIVHLPNFPEKTVASQIGTSLFEKILRGLTHCEPRASSARQWWARCKAEGE